MALRFRATMRIRDGNPYILVTATRARALRANWRRPMPVLVQVNGKPSPPWRINMMPTGSGSFFLYLHGDVRKASQTKVKDIVTIDVRFDSTYRGGPTHPMPTWFEKPLRADRAASRAWDRLIPSRQKEILRYLSWLKSDEAKRRNVERAMRALSGEPTRYMARSWKGGT